MQAIQTKFLCPTDHKGSRIKATCARGSVTVSYQHKFNAEKNHRFAALVLTRLFQDQDKTKYGTPINENPWARHFSSGQLKDGSWVHVFID